MTFTSSDPTEMMAQAQTMLESAREKALQMADVVGRGEAEEGLVTVIVNPVGTLREITLDPKAMRLPSVDLAAAILTAARAAEQDAAAQVREIWGPDLTGTFDVGAATQGKLDLVKVFDERMAKANEALRRSR